MKSIIIEGNYFTSTKEVIDISQIKIGILADSLDVSTIIQQVEALYYVKDATPYIDALGNFKITINERTPIALLIDGNNEVYVDTYGVKLPVIVKKKQNLPLVYGFDSIINSDTLSSHEFNKVSDFLESALRNQFGWATISEVIYDDYEGIIAISHENGVKLLFGKNNFDQKFENWEIFYREVIAYRGIQPMQKIDLRFNEQIITRETS